MKTVCCARDFVVTVTSQALTNQSAEKVPGCGLADGGIFLLLVQTPRRTHGTAVSTTFVAVSSSASSNYVRSNHLMWHAVIMARDQSTERNISCILLQNKCIYMRQDFLMLSVYHFMGAANVIVVIV